MRVIICDDIAQWAAHYVVNKIKTFAPSADKPFVLGLPTGKTPLSFYQQLIACYLKNQISFKHVITFNMDEYVGLSEDHPQSYHHYMHQHFFKHIDIPRDQINLLNGMATDLDAECARYEAKIKALGPIHCFVGGVGQEGHIAFNEPGSSLQSRTRVKTLTRSTRQANARYFSNQIDAVPRFALTVGVSTILDAKEVLILAQGESKAKAIYHAIEGSINHLWTISALQTHPYSIIVCDPAATSELKVKTVNYYQSLEHDYNLALQDTETPCTH